VIELEWTFYNVLQIPKAGRRNGLDIADGEEKNQPPLFTTCHLDKLMSSLPQNSARYFYFVGG
jgi:hypothetical protein